MNVCYECYETAEELKYKMDCCLKNTRKSIFEKICLEKNEHEIQIVFIKLLLEVCGFILSLKKFETNKV
tara:strand:+ start:104 stop:310 length:207 start_codon:yes stop_codon:yes gene_type:complete